jgi:heavy metal-binding protein
MKPLKFLSIVATLFVFVFVMTACGGSEEHGHEHIHPHNGTQTEATKGQPHGPDKEYTSAYVCPMHDKGSGSDEPGKCPVCSMDYVPLSDHVKDGHTH